MPAADIRLTTMVVLPDFVRDDIDVAFQWGYRNWKNCESILLLQYIKEICCAPALGQRISTTADLLALPLLYPVLSENLWSNLLHHMGVERNPTQGDMRFQDAAAMRKARIAGLGVGLVSTIDAEEDPKSGVLVAPFGRSIMAKMPHGQIPGFYRVLPNAHRRVKSIAMFCK